MPKKNSNELVKIITRREYIAIAPDVFDATKITDVVALQHHWTGEEDIVSFHHEEDTDDPLEFDKNGEHCDENDPIEWLIHLCSYAIDNGDGYGKQTFESHVLTLHDDGRSVLAAFETCGVLPIGVVSMLIEAEYASQIPGSHYAVWRIVWKKPVTVTEE